MKILLSDPFTAFLELGGTCHLDLQTRHWSLLQIRSHTPRAAASPLQCTVSVTTTFATARPTYSLASALVGGASHPQKLSSSLATRLSPSAHDMNNMSEDTTGYLHSRATQCAYPSKYS